MAYVLVDAIDCLIGGQEITLPETWVELRDATTGFNGAGSYHIQLRRGGLIGSQYICTYGLPPSDSDHLMTVWRAVLSPTGEITLGDTRRLNVGVLGVNSTIAPSPFPDGSFLETGVVTVRTIAAGVIGGGGGLLDQIGATEGDLLVRGATQWQAIAPGTSGYILTSNGTGAIPSWQAAGGGGPVTIPHGTSFPGSPTAWQFFYRDDLAALFVYNGTAWKNADSLAQLNDVAFTSLASNQILVYNGSVWVNEGLSGLLDAVLGSTRGALPERGSSGWGLLTPGSANTILVSGGSGADPAWTAFSSLLDTLLGSTRGSLVYRGASGWVELTPGTSGYVLTTQGSGADPIWQAASGGGGNPITVGLDEIRQVVGLPTNNDMSGSLAMRSDAPDASDALYVALAALHNQQIEDGAFHLYRLDDGSGTAAIDTGSSPANGTYSGTYTLGHTPSIVADQTQDVLMGGGKVTLPFNDPPADSSGSWTIELVCKLNSSSSNYWTPLTNGADPSHTNTGFGITMDVPDTNIFAVVGTGSSYVYSSAGVTPTMGTLYHIVAVYDGTTHKVQIYVNGVAGTLSAAGTYSTSGSAMEIAYGNFPLSAFSGDMAAAAFYKGKLTAGQILAHYNAVSRAATVWTPLAPAAVTSVEGLTGAVGFTSPDGSVTIGTSGGNVTLEASGGGGGSTPAPTPLQSTMTVYNSPSSGTQLFSWGAVPTAGNTLVCIDICNGSMTTPSGWTLAYSQGAIRVFTRTASGGGTSSADYMLLGSTPGTNHNGIGFEFTGSVTIFGFAGNTNNFSPFYANQIVTPTITGPSGASSLVIGAFYTSSGATPEYSLPPPWTGTFGRDIASEPGTTVWTILPPNGKTQAAVIYSSNSLSTAYSAILGIHA